MARRNRGSKPMKGIAIEKWALIRLDAIQAWLEETFGPQSADGWNIDFDYDLQTLCMSKQIYAFYVLKWGGVYKDD